MLKQAQPLGLGCLRIAAILALGLPLMAAEPAFNYAEALQKTLYFYEAQQSGQLSPNNRVTWRGPACLTDGQDIGRDLTGGWFDAGDHWTANLTMSFAAMTLAWSAVEHPGGWLKTGQMDELLESLIYVNRYFLKCVLNPDCKDPATELEVVIGCGGREGVESPNVHAIWAPAEVAHLMTHRPTFRVNKQVPAGDIPAAMAAAMAASSMVIREHTGQLKGKRGYADFDGAAFADLLLDRAEKLVLFARANAGPALSDKLPKQEQERIRKARNSALRSDGKIVETGYRAGPFDKIVAAASWLQRAHLAKNPQCGNKWFDLANEGEPYDNNQSSASECGGDEQHLGSRTDRDIRAAENQSAVRRRDFARESEVRFSVPPDPEPRRAGQRQRRKWNRDPATEISAGFGRQTH